MKRSGRSDPKGKPRGKKIHTEASRDEKIIGEISAKAALSNALILEEIFRNLAYADLVTCCKVNETWRSVADPLIYYYRIVFSDPFPKWEMYRELGICPFRVELEEVVGFRGMVHEKRSNHSMIWLLEILRSSKRKDLMSIEVHLNFVKYTFMPYGKDYMSFLTEFGDRVHVFDWETKTRLASATWILHLCHFPNLEVLRVGSDQACRSSYHWRAPLLSEPFVLKHLREIRFDDVLYAGPWRVILERAPNVTKLVGVPLNKGWVEALSDLNKIDAISSLNNWAEVKPSARVTETACRWLLDYVVTFPDKLRRLADGGVKLTSARVPRDRDLIGRLGPTDRPENATDVKKEVKRQFLRVLESSKDTLKFLKIPQAGDEDVVDKYFPTKFKMKSVKTLELDPFLRPKFTHCFFPAGMDLKEIFPTLDGIIINSWCHVRETFPRDTFGPEVLSGTVRNLKIGWGLLSQDIHKLFPFVTRLEIRSVMDRAHKCLRLVFSGWPALKHLIVFIEITEAIVEVYGHASIALDPVLTGIPLDICKKLYRQGEQILKIHGGEIGERQRENLSLFSMKDLETLEFIVSVKISKVNGLCRIPSFITSVTANHALMHLPKLSVRIKTYECEDAFEDLKDAFAPLVHFVQLEGDYVPPEIPFL